MSGGARVMAGGAALSALVWLSASGALAQPSVEIPDAPPAESGEETGLAAALSDPAEDAAPTAATVAPYVAAPARDEDPFQAQQLLEAGRPVEALALIEDLVLTRQLTFPPQTARLFAVTARRARHPDDNPLLVPLGAVFLALGAATTIASSIALAVDLNGFFSDADPVPYAILFSAAGISLFGGLTSLILGAVQHNSGPTGEFRAVQRNLLRSLRIMEIAGWHAR